VISLLCASYVLRIFCADGYSIELFVLPASQELAVAIKPSQPCLVENAREFVRSVLAKAVAEGVFDEFVLALRVLNVLKPFILEAANHAAVREAKYLEFRLAAGEWR